MAFRGRLRSTLPLLRKIAAVDSFSSAQRSAPLKDLISPSVTKPQLFRNYGTATPPPKEQKIKVPLTLFGAAGNYASALYIAAVKVNALEKVESELVDFVDATWNSAKFSQFMKDPSVSKDIRVKVMTDVCSTAKFSDITRNFLVIVAENGRLGLLDLITEKFTDLAMAHRGEVVATVTTVIPLPPQEVKEVIETLQDIIGQGKKVIVEQEVDPNILGGIVVEFNQKVFDMSIRTRARQMERFLRDPVNVEGL